MDRHEPAHDDQVASLAAFPGDGCVPIEAAPDAMLVTEHLGGIVLVNAQVEELFGYPRAELLGRPVEMLVPQRFAKVHVRERDLYFEKPRARPIGACDRELFGRRKDGSEFPAEISLSPITTERGAFVVASIRDVTARRKGDEAIRVGEQLRHAVEERDDLLRALSHDLRSPLSVIHLQAQRLAQRSDGPSEQKGLAAILTSTARMEAMIGDLVEAARIDGGQLEKRTLDLSSFVREWLGRAAGVLDAKRIEADLAETPRVLADPGALERILTNLLTNALKYSPPESLVRIRAEREGDEVVVAVIDRGPGIPEEDRPYVFDRFWRARRTKSTEGLGLGLFITRKLVTGLGGRIWVESGPEEGSAFRFTLPLA
jgi:protein-histidine pros-kinase